MASQDIVEKIISDAKAEAEATVLAANKRAEQIAELAEKKAGEERVAVQGEIAARKAFIAERNGANIRLESAKIRLKAKHDALDGVYEKAYRRLLSLEKGEALRYAERLLEENAEEGDTVCFDETFPFAEEVSALPIVERKKLRISGTRLPVGGGMVLKGEKTDKDLSYRTRLSADREEYSASIVAELFRN